MKKLFVMTAAAMQFAVGSMNLAEESTSETKLSEETTINGVLYRVGDDGAAWAVEIVDDQKEEIVFESAVSIGGNLRDVRQIGDGAHNYFGVDLSLQKVTIPSSVQVINGGFFDCKSLLEAVFMKNSQLREIGCNAFRGAFVREGVKQMHIPASVQIIGDAALSDCKKLSEVTFETGSRLQRIGLGAFMGSGVKSMRIPSEVRSIDEMAFFCCGDLAEATQEEGSKLMEIGKSAFEYCGSLKSIHITGNVSVADDAFDRGAEVIINGASFSGGAVDDGDAGAVAESVSAADDTPNSGAKIVVNKPKRKKTCCTVS